MDNEIRPPHTTDDASANHPSAPEHPSPTSPDKESKEAETPQGTALREAPPDESAIARTKTLRWQAYDAEQKERGVDWYWGLGLVTLIALAAAILLNNFLFAVIIALSAITILMYTIRKPRIVPIELTPRGIRAGNVTHPYVSLVSFWVTMNAPANKIILKSTKQFMPHISIPVADEVDPDEVRNYLLAYLPEEEQEEPFIEALIDRLKL